MKRWLKPSANWLLLFIPLTLGLERADVSPPVLFFAAALAIVPVARLIVLATEQLAARTGDAIGGLLNATFGNAPELIIALVALRAGLFDMVRASIIGAVLANLLLALGVAFVLGGIRHHDQRFNAGAMRLYSSMMLVSAISLALPSAFHRFFGSDSGGAAKSSINLIVAALLLAGYALYLLFMLRTHKEFFASVAEGAQHHENGARWSLARAVGALVGASVAAAWMSEILVGAAEGTGQALGMTQTFIGVIILAAVGGAAESGSAIAMARKNKMDLTVGIALGSSIQIALFVAPMLVFASYVVAPQPLELAFTRAEVGTLFLGVMIGTVVCGDGQANWYKGVQLATVYVLIAALFYFLPGVAP